MRVCAARCARDLLRPAVHLGLMWRVVRLTATVGRLGPQSVSSRFGEGFSPNNGSVRFLLGRGCSLGARNGAGVSGEKCTTRWIDAPLFRVHRPNLVNIFQLEKSVEIHAKSEGKVSECRVARRWRNQHNLASVGTRFDGPVYEDSLCIDVIPRYGTGAQTSA